MKVSIDEYSGFCFGVTAAIEAAERELQKGRLFCLGDIVHNGQEVKRLDEKGLVTMMTCVRCTKCVFCCVHMVNHLAPIA